MSGAYALVSLVLTLVACYMLWHSRHTLPFGVAAPFVSALLVFAIARVPFWNWELTTVEAGYLRLAIFSCLSLFGLLFVVSALLRFSPSDGDDTATRHPGYRLVRESICLGAVGAALFLFRPVVDSPAAFLYGLLNFMFVGAAIRLTAAILFGIRKSHVDLRPSLFGLALALFTSWLLYLITPVVSALGPSWTLHIARWTDVLFLSLLIVVLFSSYVRWGEYCDELAAENQKEKEDAQAELAKLNRIAKDIYEDSNDLMLKQKEQTLASMKKIDRLEKILEMAKALQQKKKLEDLLQMVASLVRDNFGFNTVVVRLLNSATKSFETMAHVGLAPEAHDRVVNYRIPVSEFEKMIEPKFRVSRSYFIKNSDAWYGDNPDGDESMLVENTWGDIDMLVVPFTDESDAIVGYLSVENPEEANISLGDIIESLENIAAIAVLGVRNARVFEELSSKNEKLKVYADKLTNLNKMKSDFVTTISHEFRTPLTSIKAYCDTLIKNADAVDHELLKEFLCVIDEESGRLMTLVEDILDFSQIESGALKFERRSCNLNEMVISATSELAKNFEFKNITLHQKLPKDNVFVQGERDLIKQLLVSLLHNATKFSKNDGNVWLRLEEEVAAVRLVVEDDGIGIPEDQLEKVFEQFYQVDSSSTREHGGSGLGLALCKSIVDWHDGKIWVQNLGGTGARFVVVIPKKQAVVNSHVLNVSSTVRRFEVERFLELILENTAELLSVNKVSLMLVDKERQELRIEAAIGVQEEVVKHAHVKLGEGISGKVARDGETLLVTDIETDERVGRSNNDPVYGSKSFLSVPIVLRGEVVGVVNVSSPIGRSVFDEKDRELLEIFVERIAISLGELERFAEVSLTYEHVRETFKAILESKRFVETRDSDIVQAIVSRAVQKLDLDNEIIATLPYILCMYDLGLAKIGYHILKKPRDLSPKDREEIEKHTILGSELLKVIEPSPRVRDVVLYHHENYDGSGYPGKLAGDAIPVEARIIRVADSLRALISDRPYQRKYTFEEAKEVLKHRSGTFFDPKVVDAFVDAIDENDDGLIPTTEEFETDVQLPEPAQ
ncbi:MAG: GAF domain-containing protein [Candidatus Latescibacterota bacterium]|nr:MAG: GAF domain-containing protein [Candidatus Latescibacterota bacterium]